MRWNRRWWCGGGLALVLALALVGCERPGGAPVGAGQTVLAFGDSVTHGTGAAPGEDWPSLLASQSGWVVVNAGVPGDTAVAARDRLPEALAQHRPALVLLELGGNDFLRRRPASEVKEDLRALIRLARDAGAQVALVAVPQVSVLALVAGRPSDAPLYADLAQEERVFLVPGVLSDVLAQPHWRADAVHPNAAGYRQLAQAMAARLRELGLWPQS